jgi:hypothetical protein
MMVNVAPARHQSRGPHVLAPDRSTLFLGSRLHAVRS